MRRPLLEIDDLRVEYPSRRWRQAPKEVLHGVSLAVSAGETLGLVGESGSGKTTIGRAVLGLAPVSGGAIRFDGEEIGHASRDRRRALARDIQVIFQDPYTSLNPSMLIADILTEPLIATGTSRRDSMARVSALLDRVGLPADTGDRLAREFSGGQRQRVAIARALAISPKLIVCDEPVSALDLSTQARVLDLLIEIQREVGVAHLFVSHDLTVVQHISHRIAVIHQGGIDETGTARRVVQAPQHEYTKRLLLAGPVTDPERQAQRRKRRLAQSA